MQIVFIILIAFVGVLLLGWVGTRVEPAPFRAIPQAQPELQTVPLPDGLPAPVERFYRQLYGDRIPIIHSAVISGRARMRPVGPISLPARFRFTYAAGEGYRHYIEATFFGLPILRVDERYLDGVGRMELPFGVFEGPKIDQGANLGLWGESLWFAASLLTDPRLRWQAVDSETALLYVPFEEREQTLLLRFDPKTGLLAVIEAMRYKAEESGAKTLWIPQVLEWGTVNGNPTMTRTSITWFDEGTPWVTFQVEGVAVNVNGGEYLRPAATLPG